MDSMSNRPTLEADETIDSYLDRYDIWKADGEWIPANNRTEVPFRTRSGRRLLYCYQPRTGDHAYLDCDTDHFLTDEESAAFLNG